MPPVKPGADNHQAEKQQLEELYNVTFKEWFCSGCGHFLFWQAIVEGTVVNKCRRCKRINVLDIHCEDLAPKPS